MHNFRFMTDCLEFYSETHPDKQAYIYLSESLEEEEFLTFEGLRARARSLARHFLNNAQAKDRALLILPSGLGFVVAFFACLYSGIVAVPLCPPNKRRSQRTLQGIIDDCGPRLIITTTSMRRSLFGQVQSELNWVDLDALTLHDDLECDDIFPSLNHCDLAFIQYTSGSTSHPKGVMVSHANIIKNQCMIRDAFGHDQYSDFVGWVPHYHDQGLIGNILQPMFIGSTSIIISPVTFMRWPLRWLQAISTYKAHTSGGPNFAFDACVASMERGATIDLDLSSWKIAFNGAEPIRSETLERFVQVFSSYGFSRNSFYPCYGLAECTLLASGGKKGQGPVTLTVDSQALREHKIKISSLEESQPLVSCGRVLKDELIAIVDPVSKIPCAANEIGEVWISGEHVARGYWGRTTLTFEIFDNHLLGDIQKTYLRTGDLGFLHRDDLYITGRIKDLVIIRGKNYYPHDIERSVSNSHCSLERSGCAAFSLPDFGEKLIVVQEVKREWRKKISKEEVISAIRKAVFFENEISPDDIVLLMPGKLLKTSSGKVMRSAIRAQYMQNTLEQWNPDAH